MIEQMAAELKQELIHLRRELHQIPEPEFEEFKTCALIKKTLTDYGIGHENILETGVLGTITGKYPGKTLLLRADIDALPINEKTNLSFKSTHDGYMHACGHDVHTACLLGAAKILAAFKNKIHGTVKLVFQPAEEGQGGAKLMIDQGIMESPRVDAAIAMHVEPFEPAGNVQIKDGAIMASPDEFECIVTGSGGHGAYPHKCIDPVLTSCMIINAFQTAVSRHIDPMTPCVVSVCSIHGGTCPNVIPDTVKFEGTVRSFDLQTRKELSSVLEKIAVETAHSMGADCCFRFKPLFPPLINNSQINQIVIQAAEKLSCVNQITRLEHASMAGDDFSYFAQLVPSAYFKLGIGNRDALCNKPLHHAEFMVNEDALPVGSAVLAQAAINFLCC